MTVASVTRKQIYNGSGSSGPFTFNFRVLSEDHITVTKIVGGVKVPLSSPADYTITLMNLGLSGGSITLTDAMASGSQMVIQGVTPITQEVNFSNQGAFFPESHEDAYDKATIIIQELSEQLDASVRANPLDDASLDMSLPLAAERANKYFTFDSNGQPTVASLVVTGVPVSDYMAGILSKTSYYALRLAAGVQQTAMNYVLNPSFIHQLAALPSSPADNDFIFPKWRALMEASNAFVPSLGSGTLNSTDSVDGQPLFVGDRLRMTVGSANNNKFGIVQFIEGKLGNLLRANGVPLSLQAVFLRNATSGINNVKMAIIGWTGTQDSYSDPISSWGAEGTNPTLAANWQYISTPANLNITTVAHRYKIENVTNLTSSNLAVLIWVDDKTTTTGSDWLEVSNVMLERGESCTEFTRLPLADGVQSVQRDYESIAGNGKIVGSGVCISSTAAKISVPMQVAKRAAMTLAISSAGHFTIDDGTGTPVTATAISLNSASTPAMALLDVTVASGLTAGRGTYMLTSNASSVMEFKSLL